MRALRALVVSLGLAALACMPQTAPRASEEAVPRAVVVAAAAPTLVAPPRPLVVPTHVPPATPTAPAAESVPPRATSASVGVESVSAPGGEVALAAESVPPRPASAAPALAPGLTFEVADGLLPEPGDNYAVVLEDLGSGARLALNDQRVFPSGSLYKLGVAWAVLRQVDAGSLQLDEPLLMEPEDAVEPEPDGGLGPGDAPSVAEALGAMLTISSNTAAHAFLRTLGRHEFNLEMHRIGLEQTRVPEEGDDEGEQMAVTSAADIARLLRLISTQQLSGAARAELAHGMANVAPPDPLREILPEGVELLDKTGNLEDASDIGAVLRTDTSAAILVVLDQGVGPGDARGVIAGLGQVAYDALLRQPE
jgi:beta-lactamase class A